MHKYIYIYCIYLFIFLFMCAWIHGSNHFLLYACIIRLFIQGPVLELRCCELAFFKMVWDCNRTFLSFFIQCYTVLSCLLFPVFLFFSLLYSLCLFVNGLSELSAKRSSLLPTLDLDESLHIKLRPPVPPETEIQVVWSWQFRHTDISRGELR